MPDSVAAGLRLAPEELTRPFAPEQFAFDTTDDLEPFRGVLGQERAVEALQFGVAMPRPGYNVFVMGEPGTGRFSFVKRYLQAEGKRVATPSDWVYLNNFDEPREPRVIELPPGSATEFSADIDRLIDNLMSTFPAVFEHPAYQQKKNAVDRAFNQRYDRALDSVERRALEKDVALYRDSANVAFTPMKDGKALDEAEFAQLPEAERERFQGYRRPRGVPQRGTGEPAAVEARVEQPVARAQRGNHHPAAAGASGGEVQQQPGRLRLPAGDATEPAEDRGRPTGRRQPHRRPAQARLIEQYAPNQAIVHHATSGAPVVFESHPTYDNLFGRIEYSSDQGRSTPATGSCVRGAAPGQRRLPDPGSGKMLGEPFVWDALKRALQSRQLKMESPLAELGRLAAVSLTPGDPAATEGDHHRLAADLLHPAGPRPGLPGDVPGAGGLRRGHPAGRDSLEQFAQLLKTRTSEEGMAPLSGAAVARLATYSARLAEHQGRLSARIGDLFQLVSEADFIRQLANEEVIQLGHIERALKAKQTRTGRVSARILDDMLAGIILIDTAGAAVGKCNGLTVLEVGDSVFGVPARISATVYPAAAASSTSSARSTSASRSTPRA